MPPEVDVVLVHDAARPLAPSDLVDAVAAAVLAGHHAVVPGLAMTDTVKRVAGEASDGAEQVLETVPRTDLRCIQTPQGFDRAVLAKAHAAADGTMVVAERSRDRIGDEVMVRVTSVLTTANGRMVFGQPVAAAAPDLASGRSS